MYKIALLNLDGIITEIQEGEDLQDTIQALKLTDDDYLNLADIELPVPSNGCVLKYDRDTKTFAEVEYCELEQPETQLDRIESAVNDIAKNNTSYAEMAQAIAEGVNDIE